MPGIATSSDSRPEDRTTTPKRVDRSRSLAVCAAIFAFAAVLIVVNKRGLLDGIANQAAGIVGLALALTGLLFFIYIWSSDRFRFSIRRLMAVVAVSAVLIQGILIWVRWMKHGLP
jgi:hypothetical protein